MSRQECFKHRYPYPPSQWNLQRVEEVLSKKFNRAEGCNLWEGISRYGLSNFPLPDKFQVLAWDTEEAYLVIKVGREVFKYLKDSLLYRARDMVEARCRMSNLHKFFNPQILIHNTVITSPFCGGRKASRTTVFTIRKILQAKGFVSLWDIDQSNVKETSEGPKIIDFTILPIEKGNMMNYYRWDLLETS